MNIGLILLSWGTMIAVVVAALLKMGILTIRIERQDEDEIEEDQLETDQNDD